MACLSPEVFARAKPCCYEHKAHTEPGNLAALHTGSCLRRSSRGKKTESDGDHKQPKTLRQKQSKQGEKNRQREARWKRKSAAKHK